MKKNILVGQSGGPTAVINSSLYGVLVEGKAHSEAIDQVLGMINGINGLLEDRIMNLSELEDDKAKLLRTTPAAYLGSCRYKLPSDLADPVYPVIFDKLKQYNIGYFLYIGGNDSMVTAVLQSLWHLWYARWFWMQKYIIRNLLILLKLWAVLPDG